MKVTTEVSFVHLFKGALLDKNGVLIITTSDDFIHNRHTKGHSTVKIFITDKCTKKCKNKHIDRKGTN